MNGGQLITNKKCTFQYCKLSSIIFCWKARWATASTPNTSWQHSWALGAFLATISGSMRLPLATPVLLGESPASPGFFACPCGASHFPKAFPILLIFYCGLGRFGDSFALYFHGKKVMLCWLKKSISLILLFLLKLHSSISESCSASPHLKLRHLEAANQGTQDAPIQSVAFPRLRTK